MNIIGLILSVAITAHAHFEGIGGRILIKEYGLSRIDNGIRKAEVIEQKVLGGRFSPALRSAMNCFLKDSTHVESPLAVAIDVAYEILNEKESLPTPPNVLKKARALLHSHMDLPSTKLRLISQRETPEGGEHVTENWIFEIKIKTLSDHIQWAIVNRMNAEKTYCYGFN